MCICVEYSCICCVDSLERWYIVWICMIIYVVMWYFIYVVLYMWYMIFGMINNIISVFNSLLKILLNNCWMCWIAKFWYKCQNYDTRTFVHHRNTLVFTTNTLNQILADSKNKTVVLFFGYFGSFLLPSKIRLVFNVHFYYKMHIENNGYSSTGICLHFKVIKCFAVPV